MAEKQNTPEIRFEGFTDPWEQRKLGEVASIKTGPFGSLLHAEDYVVDGIPIVTTEHFKSGFLPDEIAGLPQVSESDRARLEQYSAIEGDILFSRVGSVDVNAQVTAAQSGWLFSGRVLRARPTVSVISPNYLHYELSTDDVKRSIINRAVGGTMASINTEILEDTEISFPRSRTEQLEIGRSLGNLDSLIALHQRKYDKLCTVKKSMLDKMFPKLGETEPEIRFEGFTDPWEQRKLGELCTFSKGHGYSKADIRDAGTPLILYGRLYTQYESRIEEVDTFTVEQDGSILSRGNEVIVPASGETAEDIAIASSVRRSGIILGGDLNVVTPTGKLDPDYTALAITYSKAHDDLAKRAQGKSVVHVHGNDIAEVEISYPSESEQKRISSVVLNLDSLITLHQRKLELLRNIKKSLLDRMFV